MDSPFYAPPYSDLEEAPARDDSEMPDGMASTPPSVLPSKPFAAPSKKPTAEPITISVPDLPAFSRPRDPLKEIPWVD